MTRREIVKRYTRVRKTGDRWRCDLLVGCQGFTVIEDTTRERARWFAKMLGIAIEAIIKEARE
jgi:hypothetical protein